MRRIRGSALQSTAHGDTGILDLSDELIKIILGHLNFEELARMHMVSQRFNGLLSSPDPSQRIYGSVTVNVDRDGKGSLPPTLIERYLLKRAAGFDCVCFQSWSARQEGQQDWDTRQHDWKTMHTFFATSLPQLAAVFALYNVQMEISALGGGLIFFPNPQSYEEDQDLYYECERYYSAEYWFVLSLALTKLSFRIEGGTRINDAYWLNAMQKLQHLELRGFPSVEGPRATLNLYNFTLGLPVLKVLRLESFELTYQWYFKCPSLEALHLRDLRFARLPTGLGACSRLTTLDVAAPLVDPVHMNMDAGLFAAVESVQGTLEVLDISGWASYPRLNEVVDLVSRLPRLHTLVAQRNVLTVVPALPATLKSLDLRANDFTEIPVQLESLTHLTSLAFCSKNFFAEHFIQRPLDALISLPQLRELTLLRLDSDSDSPAYERWDAFALYYLGLARHEIARSKRSLLLKF